MSDTWLPVVGYEGLYEVSDQGRVRSLDRTLLRVDGSILPIKGILLKGTPHKVHGYIGVNLGRKYQKVHILVLTAFVGPRPTGMEACHNNGDRSDNRLANLRWDTPSSNQQDSVKHGTHKEARKTVCGTCGGEYTQYAQRVCLTCKAKATRKYQRRKRGER